MNGYAKRSASLKKLGFSSYKEYLASDLWKKVKAKVFQCKGRACELCGNGAVTVHHNRYHANDLTGRKLKYLIPICHGCHEEIEFGDGRKLTLAQARSKCKQRRKERHREVTLANLIWNYEAEETRVLPLLLLLLLLFLCGCSAELTYRSNGDSITFNHSSGFSNASVTFQYNGEWITLGRKLPTQADHQAERVDTMLPQIESPEVPHGAVYIQNGTTEYPTNILHRFLFPMNRIDFTSTNIIEIRGLSPNPQSYLISTNQ